MWIEIEHQLRFEYDAFIRESRMELRTQPCTSEHQTLRSFVLAVGPPAAVNRYRDWIGNQVHHFAIHDFHDRIEVQPQALVNTHPQHPALEALTNPPGPRQADHYDWLALGGPVARSKKLDELATVVTVGAGAPIGEQVAAIGHLVLDRFEYRTGVTDYESTTDNLLTTGAGVCQDFAHVMLALLRMRGIPCRYVSGYLHLGSDRPAESHAWVEVLAGERGWVGFDPTHGIVPDERYIVVGHGRNYHDVPPNRGIYQGVADEKLEAEVHTREVAPRDLAQIHEQVARIDLPVFRELPVLRSGDPDARPDEHQHQEQQQQ